MSFRRCTFAEIRDNLIVAMMENGVAAETHPFPPPDGVIPYRHLLEQKEVDSIESLYGSMNGGPHLFRPGTDYVLLEDKRTLEWQKKADLPDPGTVISVNYLLPKGANQAAIDFQTGSVIRTLAESVAMQVAGLYAQLDAVYRSGFITTAEGTALDNVVALLGIARLRGGRRRGRSSSAGLPEATVKSPSRPERA